MVALPYTISIVPGGYAVDGVFHAFRLPYDDDDVVDAVFADRQRLWAAGFRPVPVASHDAPGQSPSKRPVGDRWTDAARQNPPPAAMARPHHGALNTGILCDGLRAVDIDIDNPTLAASVARLARQHLGDAPARVRDNSSRLMLVYRAAEGEPPKRSIAGTLGKVEVMGRGQHVVCFGTHATGAALRWEPPENAPGVICRDQLRDVTEEQVDEFLEAVAAVIGAKPPTTAADTDRQPSGEGARASMLGIAAALNDIPNSAPADWNKWKEFCMAVYAATGGSTGGFEAFNAWSAQHPAYDPDETRRAWEQVRASPPDRIGAGTIFHMAAEAKRERQAIATRVTEAAARKAEPSDRPAAAQAARPPQRPAALRVLTPADCAASQPRGYIVKGLLAPGDLFLLVAKPGGGKSALAPSIGYAIAQGREVFKRRTKPGTVLYVPVEDPHGMRQRVHALRKEHGDAPGFLVVEGVSDLFSADSPDPEALSALAQERGASLVIIDTLAAAFRGMDELSGQEMGRAIAVARDLTAQGCAVMLLCHPNKATQSDGTPRGHGSLQAEADVAMFLEWAADGGAIAGTITKNRNGPADAAGLTFSIRSVRVGTDEDGDAITAAMAVETDAFGQSPGAAGALIEAVAERKFLEMLDWHEARGMEISPSVNAKNYAPTMFGKNAMRVGVNKRQFEAAMNALLDRGAIEIVEYGRPSRRCKKLMRAGAAMANADDGEADTTADPDDGTE